MAPPCERGCWARTSWPSATQGDGSACWTSTARTAAPRWLYHGWKFDVDGNVLDMSSEPAESRLRANLKHRAYPTREAGGFVWAWLGRDALAPFQPPAWAPSPTTKISIVKMHAACNWAQVLEGSIDSAHSSSLHSTNMPAAQVAGST